MKIVIDVHAAEAPYEQVKLQIVAAVDAGVLAPGDKLPPVRTLATELGLAANTVARAYKELESTGVVATRGRAGTVVLGPGRERAVREAAAGFVSRMRELGVSDAEAVELVRRTQGS